MTEQFTFGGDIVWRPKKEYADCVQAITVMRLYYSRRLEGN